MLHCNLPEIFRQLTLKMSEIYATKGSVQFAPEAAATVGEIAQDGTATELMSENVLLVPLIV
jgi:hypothetical protein